MKNSHKTIAVIIPAAGSSTRIEGGKKQFAPFPKKPNASIVSQSISRFLSIPFVRYVVVCLPKDDFSIAIDTIKQDARIAERQKKHNITLLYVRGGNTRQASVHAALTTIAEKKLPVSFVLIHDAARPYVSRSLIKRVAKMMFQKGAVAPVIPVVDTQKKIDNKELIIEHLNRSEIAAVQTPQAFPFEKILQAHQNAARDNIEYTDDTELYARYCAPVYYCAGEQKNKKITFAGDLPKTKKKRIYRTGIGYDLHRLVAERPLILGGIRLESEKGCEAHSDGDALLHAITDALLGAAALSDIGELFPPSDMQWKNISSSVFLTKAKDLLEAGGWTIENIDCVILLQKPTVLPYRKKIRQAIAQALQIDETQIFVKAKSGEHIGIIGSQQAIACFVTCLISNQAPK